MHFTIHIRRLIPYLNVFYMQCLENIFPLSSIKTKRIIVYGDNDIGGEGRDFMTEETVL